MKRDPRSLVAVAAIVAWMWLATWLVHELGHVLTAYATGGRVVEVELRPGPLPHTLVQPNPSPGAVLWGGFLVGWLAPQLTAPLWRVERGMAGPVLRAWAAFCLLAGGAYLAVGGVERLTDTGQLSKLGWPLWLLVAIGAAVATLGYARSRAAWIAIGERLKDRPLDWRTAAAWWAWLLVWIAGQSTLHAFLQPVDNVR